MFYVKEVMLDERFYIVGLQTKLPMHGNSVGLSTVDREVYQHACRRLDQNMAEVERILGGMYFFSATMRRQDDSDDYDGFDSSADSDSD